MSRPTYTYIHTKVLVKHYIHTPTIYGDQSLNICMLYIYIYMLHIYCIQIVLYIHNISCWKVGQLTAALGYSVNKGTVTYIQIHFGCRITRGTIWCVLLVFIIMITFLDHVISSNTDHVINQPTVAAGDGGGALRFLAFGVLRNVVLLRFGLHTCHDQQKCMQGRLQVMRSSCFKVLIKYRSFI